MVRVVSMVTCHWHNPKRSVLSHYLGQYSIVESLLHLCFMFYVLWIIIVVMTTDNHAGIHDVGFVCMFGFFSNAGFLCAAHHWLPTAVRDFCAILS